jgi:hypothetical protein
LLCHAQEGQPGTRSDDGRDCRDAFLSLAKTCTKLGIAVWDYLGSLRRAFRSVVSTANANGASVYDTIRFVPSAKRNVEVMAGVG